MQLIILAAGIGSRLGNLTSKIPKSLIKIRQKSLIEFQINQFRSHKIKKIIIVTGFGSKIIKKQLGNKIDYIFNKKFRTTNNMYSLWMARRFLKKEDTIITFADLIMSKHIIKKIINSKHSINVAIDTSRILKGTMTVKVKKNNLINIGKKNELSPDGNFIGISKIKKNKINLFQKALIKIANKKKKEYYTEVFNYLIDIKKNIKAIDIKRNFWKEVDTKKDLLDLKKKIKSQKIYNII
jgi:L-glutamine-phosphate cytidylyltransferase